MSSDEKINADTEATFESENAPSEDPIADISAEVTDPPAELDSAEPTTNVENLAASETEASSLTETPVAPLLDGEEGATDALNGAPAEDSGETATMEVEDAVSELNSQSNDVWRVNLKRFYTDVNRNLTEKETIKLDWLGKKVQAEFILSWKVESNKHFKLAVNLRRRRGEGKFGGKIIA